MEASRDSLIELLELQKIDSTLDRLNHRRRNLPEQLELDALEDKAAGLDSLIARQQAIVDEAAARQRRLDADIDTMSAKIAGEEAKLYSGDVASPRELAAIQSEVEALRRRRSSVEDSDLEVMGQREAAEGELASLKEEAEKLAALLTEARLRRDAAVAEIAAELDEAQLRRGQWAPKFDNELLTFYEDIRTAKGGVAVALLSDGACTGCHMKLPAQEVTRLKRTEAMARCVECGRILVVS